MPDLNPATPRPPGNAWVARNFERRNEMTDGLYGTVDASARTGRNSYLRGGAARRDGDVQVARDDAEPHKATKPGLRPFGYAAGDADSKAPVLSGPIASYGSDAASEAGSVSPGSSSQPAESETAGTSPSAAASDAAVGGLSSSGD